MRKSGQSFCSVVITLHQLANPGWNKKGLQA
jgi:hypothetical protein